MIGTLTCMAVAIYFEPRGEPIDGQMMVAETIINRAADPRWPDTVCEVVKQPDQFSFYSDGKSDRPRDLEAYARAVLVAAEALEGNHMHTGALYYHATAVRPVWRHELQVLGQVGEHIFYANTKDCRLPTCSPRPVPRPERQQ
jgi:spore germination cell wall hydrolase CwlJ-like protein